jgi:hypothetical protein
MILDNDFNFLKNYLLDELKEIHKLSVRSYNVCKQNSLTDLKSILSFFLKNKSFSKLKNAGMKSNFELIDLTKSYLKDSSDLIKFSEKRKYRLKIDNLALIPKEHKEYISLSDESYFFKKYVFFHIHNLNNKIASVINEKLPLLTPLEFIDFFEKYDINQIRGIGVGKAKDFHDLIVHLRDVVNKSLADKHYLHSPEFVFDALNYFLNNRISKHDFMENYVNTKNNSYYIFKLINDLLPTEYFGNNKDYRIFVSRNSVFANESKQSMRDIAREFKLTGERIRQLNEIIAKMIWIKVEALLFITNYSENSLFDYLEEEGCLSSIDYNKIHKIENNVLSEDFINKVVVIVLANSFFPLYLTKKQKRFLYFIDNKYVGFDFNKFIMDTSELKASSEDFRFKIEVNKYVKKFALNKKIIDADLQTICKKIFDLKFDAETGDDGSITLERNYRYMYEYAVEILEEHGKPMKLDQLFRRIDIRYPGTIKSYSSLRGNLQGTKKIIYFGRSSTYGLKKWEDEGKFRGGTIKSIVEEYLNKFDRPKHISEITEYVNKYRKTNEFNILGNLKFDTRGTFSFYNSGFVGLTEKTYDPELAKFNKLDLNLFRKSFTKMFQKDEAKYPYDVFINKLAKINKVSVIQIDSIIKNRIKNGKMIKTKDGILIRVKSK